MTARMKPVAFARQEDLIELGEGLNQLADLVQHIHGDLSVYARAIETLAQDMENVSDILVSAGLLEFESDDEGPEPDEDGVEIPEDEQATDDEAEEEPEDEFGALEDRDESDSDAEPVVESAAERRARQEAVRARRAQTVQEQGLKAFEDGNESPEGEATEISDITDVPEEGVTVHEPRSPFGRLNAEE